MHPDNLFNNTLPSRVNIVTPFWVNFSSRTLGNLAIVTAVLAQTESMEEEAYWAGDANRPSIKACKTANGWLWEIRTWLLLLIGKSDSDSAKSRLKDETDDRLSSWQQQMKELYPNRPTESINCAATTLRYSRGLGGAMEFTCSSYFLMSMLSWALRARRRPKEHVLKSIPLFQSVVNAVLLPGTVLRFQSKPYYLH